jgi:hypothetical protein
MQEAIAEQEELVRAQQEQLTQVQERYDQLAQDYQSRDEQLTQYLEGLGAEERKALEKQRMQLKASQKEDLMRRGLTSTSALNAAMRGVDLAANESLSQMENRLRQQKLDYKAQFSGESLAAKRMAAEYGSEASMLMFQSGTMVPQTMAQLAQMLSEQRIAREQNRYGIAGAALGAEAQRFSATQSAAASKYATQLGYKSDIAGLQQRERESQRQNLLGRQKLQAETALGYAGLDTQRYSSRMASKTGGTKGLDYARNVRISQMATSPWG